MNDISFPPEAKIEMHNIEAHLSQKFEKISFKFNAGL
jgi:hypothetical protein